MKFRFQAIFFGISILLILVALATMPGRGFCKFVSFGPFTLVVSDLQLLSIRKSLSSFWALIQLRWCHLSKRNLSKWLYTPSFLPAVHRWPDHPRRRNFRGHTLPLIYPVSIPVPGFRLGWLSFSKCSSMCTASKWMPSVSSKRMMKLCTGQNS